MPTLLEKPAANPVPTLPPSEVIRLRHRWERWRGVLMTAAIGLAVTFLAVWLVHAFWPTPGSAKAVAIAWAGGFVLTLLAAFVGWRYAPASLLDTAQQLDRDLTTKNRLEAAATLQGSTSPLALAQREETTAYLRREAAGVRPGRALPWLVGGILVLIAAHLITLAVWVMPAFLHPTVPEPPKPAPPKVMPKASITWKSPEAESKANPIEEVPTVALTQSTTGLKDLSLEISVNGVFKKSVPLPAKPFDQPGRNTLKSSLYMDELDVQPYDVVTYFIRAQRIAEQKLADTTSEIQFIQVRPFRDDVKQVHGGDVNLKNYDLLIRVKLAELRSIKENFVLAHTDLPVTDPLRMKENDRVGKNQGELSAKTEEVVQAFIQAGLPSDIIDLLQQAEQPMDDASKQILAAHNAQALVPQEKALSLIVEVEKFFIKVMADRGSAPPSNNPDDPFKDKQKHELKKRMEVAAGQLETLAKNQTKLADDLNHPGATAEANSPAPATPDASGTAAPPPDANPTPGTPPGSPGANADGAQKEVPLPPAQAVDPFGPDAGKGTFTERQARVLQGVETLLNGNTVLPPAVTDALQAAQKDAGESMHDLDQDNEADARGPAATAAQDLQSAIAEMNKAGEKETKQAMEEGQQKLNDLARQLGDLARNGSPGAQQKLADLAQQVADVRKNLENEADHQQEAGSATGAQRLDQLAKDIANQKIEDDLTGMAKNGLDANKAKADADKLEELAGQAAQSSIPGKPSAQDLATLINSLEKSRANLARLAQQMGAAVPDPTGRMGAPIGITPNPDKTGAGNEAGKNPAEGEQGQGQHPGSDQGEGKGQQTGANRGQAPGQQPAADQGEGKGQQTGTEKGQGEGKNPAQGESGPGTPSPDKSGAPGSGGSDEGTAAGSGNQSEQPKAPTTVGSGVVARFDPHEPPSAMEQGYREVMADLKDEAQQAQSAVPSANVGALLANVNQALDDAHYRPANPSNVVAGYQAIAAPLDQLIYDLEAAAAHAQRDEIVKQPDLDDAPPAYRSAVSDYFESMSRDYHPDSGDESAKKP